MTVTLYPPGQQPITKSAESFSDLKTVPFAEVPTQVAVLLDCAPSLVDVLANGEGFVVYTVFDSEGEVNSMATEAVAMLTGFDFCFEDEDTLLRGPVLIVRQ